MFRKSRLPRGYVASTAVACARRRAAAQPMLGREQPDHLEAPVSKNVDGVSAISGDRSRMDHEAESLAGERLELA